MGQSDSEIRNKGGDSFACQCARLLETFSAAVNAAKDPQGLLDSQADAVYVKTLDGQIVFSNSSYLEVFAGTPSAVGRFAETFLTDAIVPVSRLSDAMIGAGCAEVEFEHSGVDVRGRSVLLRSFKASLEDVGRPWMAIFGVTRVIQVRSSEASGEAKELWDQCQAYQQLSPTESAVAVMLVRGSSEHEIASCLKLNGDAVDAHRQTVCQKLGVSNPQQLVMLMVRLQDGGYIDVGI